MDLCLRLHMINGFNEFIKCCWKEARVKPMFNRRRHRWENINLLWRYPGCVQLVRYVRAVPGQVPHVVLEHQRVVLVLYLALEPAVCVAQLFELLPAHVARVRQHALRVLYYVQLLEWCIGCVAQLLSLRSHVNNGWPAGRPRNFFGGLITGFRQN